jgi:hypothetical protein
MSETVLQEFQALMCESSRLVAVQAQIEKDFALSGFVFSGPLISWEVLLLELSAGIATLRNRNAAQWMKIVYRVDLTEKQYRFVQALGGDSDENLAKAVVLREFQKIITRERYSG